MQAYTDLNWGGGGGEGREERAHSFKEIQHANLVFVLHDAGWAVNKDQTTGNYNKRKNKKMDMKGTLSLTSVKVDKRPIHFAIMSSFQSNLNYIFRNVLRNEVLLSGDSRS